MKKSTLFLALFLLVVNNCIALPSIKHINLKLSNFKDTIDLSSPAMSYVSFLQLQYKGKVSKFREVKSSTMIGYLPTQNTPDIQVSENERQSLLSTIICSSFTFNNCLAAVVTQRDNQYIIGWTQLENERWLNLGESIVEDSTDITPHINKIAPFSLSKREKQLQLEKVSKDTVSFINYLSNTGRSPKEYILDKLNSHKLVIYGEVHKRRKSWEILKSVIASPAFAKSTRTIFMELPSHTQNRMDEFMNKQNIDSNTLLSILQDEQIYGWEDRGMFEFLCTVWQLNKKLGKKSKIRVITADYQLPFSEINSKEELYEASKKRVNRDENMSNVILSNLNNHSALFIVGVGHARKFSVSEEKPRAAALLKAQLGSEVFCIFSHSSIIDNLGNDFGKIREGLFDTVFAMNKNAPVGFDLNDSPFGDELFDGHNEIRFNKNCGRFKDVYDGYLFIEPLDDMEANYYFTDLFNDEFVKELKRRANVFSLSDGWYTIPIGELTKERILKLLKSQ